MKRIALPLLLCGIPTAASAQDVRCLECSHLVSVYKGEGGLIAEVDGTGAATFLASCGNVTISGDVAPDADGKVALAFSVDNGLACGADDGYLEIGPLADGGWYWITDDRNTAVGSLIGKNVLGNASTEPTNAGPGVEVTEGMGAVMVKETSTGRVGILPTVLPIPEADPAPANRCSYTAKGPETTNCMLGDGGTKIRARGPVHIYTGDRDPIADGGTVTRPAVGEVVVSFDLWGNGTGHYSNTAATPKLGHPGGTPLDATFSGAYGSGLTGSEPAIDPGDDRSQSGAAAGLALNPDGDNDDIAHLTIYPNATYCNDTPPANRPVTVSISADADGPAEVTPRIVENRAGDVAATLTLTVVCPSGAARQGVELVPENPFPADR